MKAKDLRELSLEDLKEKREELLKDLLHLKLQHATAQLENPMRLRQVRRDIARIETVLREKNAQ